MKELRDKLKLPQSTMAQLLDLGLSNLMAIEKGRRPLPKSQKANYRTLLRIASMPQWEKLEAQSTEEEEVQKAFVEELANELKQQQFTLDAAIKRQAQLLASYKQHTQILKSLSAVEALMDDSVDALFKTQVAYSKGKVKYAMRYKLLSRLFSIKIKINMAKMRIEMIEDAMNNPLVSILRKESDL